MSAGIWFWIIYVLVLLLGLYFYGATALLWPGLVIYVLIGLLGWGVFGPPIK